ncbi:MAG: gluconolaconase [Bacteroidetes bacterium]|nr:MAG: gluconolaconase [Bacteroidota bacterium]
MPETKNMLDKCEIFAEGLDHAECVVAHPDGSIWAGGEAGQIYRIPPEGGKVDLVAETDGFILGLAFSPGAEWLAICDLKNKCVWRLDIDSMSMTLFTKGVEGHDFNIPNYPVFDQEGNLYVSESGEFRKVNGKILKFDDLGKGDVWHEGPFNFANGLAMFGSYLYVVSSFMPGVERIKIEQSGIAGEREVFCMLPKTVPDGLAFDAEGDLYISCYAPNRIYKVSNDATPVVLVDDWEAHMLSNPTNIAFGGNDFDQLFTSNLGRWHITKIDVGVKGSLLVSHL